MREVSLTSWLLFDVPLGHVCACDICCCSEKQVGWMSGWTFSSVRTIIAVTLIHDSSAYVHVSRVETASACGLGNISQQALRNAQSCCKQPIRSELPITKWRSHCRRQMCLHRNASLIHGFQTPLWGTFTAETELARATFFLPSKRTTANLVQKLSIERL